MTTISLETGVEIFSTCPQSSEATGRAYLAAVRDVAQWSERYGCTGILVYSDNRLVDPWLVSQVIIQATSRLCPLVAVQPIYLHPYAVATLVASLGHLYRRRVYLNMVAGGFVNDLTALDDPTPHDRRYDRLREYTEVVTRLLRETGPVTYAGEFYRVKNLKLSPALAGELFPGVFVSGSSSAGLAAARTLGATAIKYPQPPGHEADDVAEPGVSLGARIGIIARETSEEAWRVARARFPADRKGELTRQFATKVSDSNWHRTLSSTPDAGAEQVYWLTPFHHYQTNCPYLVGSYDEVADLLSRYLGLGYRTFILDIPPAEQELRHTSIAFERALGLVAR